MCEDVFCKLNKGKTLSLASLSLLVPPLQLQTASMWQVLKNGDAMNYWKVAEFLCTAVDMVPELLMDKHKMQLDLGLRARFILQLCRSEPLLDSAYILSHLDYIREPFCLDKDKEDTEARVQFVKLIQNLLTRSDYREDFFMNTFPAQYGPVYDSDLQTLFSEFLCRLTELLPVPDLQLTVSWLEDEADAASMPSASDYSNFKTLLQHHKCLAELKQPVSALLMGDNILSSLCAGSVSLIGRSEGELFQPETQLMLPQDNEVYVEVELVTVADSEMLMQQNNSSGSDEQDPSVVVSEEIEGDKDTQGAAMDVLTSVCHTKKVGNTRQRVPSERHECLDCDKKFRFASSLTAHRVIHTGERPHSCEACGRCFSFRQSLDRHRHMHKTEYDCSICSATYDSLSKLTEHKKGHVEVSVYNPLRCQTPRQLNTEGSGSTGEPVARHCENPDCVKLLDLSLAEAGHSPPTELDSQHSHDINPQNAVRTSGRKRKPTMKVQEINLQKSLPTKRRKTLKKVDTAAEKQLHNRSSEHSYGTPFLPLDGCKSESDYGCHASGEFLAAQQEHDGTYVGDDAFCSECGRAFRWKSALVRHIKTHNERESSMYKCSHCDLGLKNVSLLNKHLLTHEQDRVHQCDCGKIFAHKAALTAHQRVHLKDRQHVCPECGKGFLYKGGLQSHMKIHSAEMPFVCSHCGKRFKRERNMKKHERFHTRENVFCCTQCDKSFVYKATLIRHELTHSGKRPFLCSNCGKSFFSHAELLKHERFHTGYKPFQCLHCGKTFTQSCYLTVHMRYHTGARPYSCTACDKSFLSAYRLKRHQQTHTGDKPFVCGECGKRFGQSYQLKLHQKTHMMTLK